MKPLSVKLSCMIVAIGLCTAAPREARAVVIYQNIDPMTADINTLSETLAGGFESNTVDSKNIYAWGLVIQMQQNATLRSAIAPFNVGPSTGLRLDVFEVPNPLPVNLRGFTGPTVITTAFVHLGSSLVVQGLPAGRQWITFSFDDLALENGKDYLFRASPHQTNSTFTAQQHYWLGASPVSSMVRDIRYFPLNTAVPEDTWGDTSPQYGSGSIQLSDTPAVAVPTPTALCAALGGIAMLLARRRRHR